MLRLGAHESIAGGLYRALERGAEAGCEALQMWVKNSRQWSAPPLTSEEVSRFQEVRAATGIAPVIAHASYLINLAAADEELRRRSCLAMIDELERCEQLELPGIVLHPGSHNGAGESEGLARIARSLEEIHAPLPGYRVHILLETMAGQGTNLGHRLEQLGWLLQNCTQPERLGICLDTCHLSGAGYDLTTDEGYAIALEKCERIIGLEKIQALHLNDSRHPTGSRRDRHTHIGEGSLGLAAFRRLLTDPRLDGRPGLLETPKSDDLHEDRENLARLRALVENQE